MAQNNRNQSGRSDYGRGGRYQTGGDQDRHRTGGEQRFNPNWDDRNRSSGGVFEGDRSYSAGGHSEEFGNRGGRNRDDQDRDWQGQQNRGSSGANYQSGRGYGGNFGNEDQSRFGEGPFDEGNRWSEGAGASDSDDNMYTRDRGSTTSSWHEDNADRGGYFNTGNYIDDGDSWRGFGRDFERARQQVRQRYGSGGGSSGSSRNYNTGDAGSYSRGYYGSQSGNNRNFDDRQQGQSWSGQQSGGRAGQQFGSGNYGSSRSSYGSSGSSGSNFGGGRSSGNYDARSSWDYDQGGRGQRAGSGSSGGAYGSDSGYRSDFSSYEGGQSHRGRGPQGYQRSDERLKEIVCERLTDDPAIDASNVSIEVTGQVVKLTGTVDDRNTKYEIEELIESLGGVKDIDNQLRVQRQSSWGQSSSSQSPSGQQSGSEWQTGSSGASTTGSTSGRSTSSTTNATSGTTGSTSGTTGSNKRN